MTVGRSSDGRAPRFSGESSCRKHSNMCTTVSWGRTSGVPRACIDDAWTRPVVPRSVDESSNHQLLREQRGSITNIPRCPPAAAPPAMGHPAMRSSSSFSEAPMAAESDQSWRYTGNDPTIRVKRGRIGEYVFDCSSSASTLQWRTRRSAQAGRRGARRRVRLSLLPSDALRINRFERACATVSGARAFARAPWTARVRATG